MNKLSFKETIKANIPETPCSSLSVCFSHSLVLELVREKQWFWKWLNPWSSTEICFWLADLIWDGFCCIPCIVLLKVNCIWWGHYYVDIFNVCMCVRRRRVIASRMFQIAASRHWELQSFPLNTLSHPSFQCLLFWHKHLYGHIGSHIWQLRI